MNKPFALNKEAQRLASELLAQANENEPNITEDLQTIATEVLAEMVGLEHIFKTEDSLSRKLVDKSYENLRRLPKKAETINDVLRYTFILPIQNYAIGISQTVEKLRELTYQIPEDKIWNAWQTIGSIKDRGYRGFNITVISFKSQKFELQFHTEESFGLKMQTHYLYEELRDRKISSKREAELISILKEMAVNIKRPQGV